MKRSDNLTRLDKEFDVLVVGAGATGLGVAVDAAARGYATVVVDAGDFACGTSSRSTNLVHGGVRYLQQGNVRLVRQALRERGLLIENAPHVVDEVLFLVPSYTWWSRPLYGVALKMYDLMAGSLGLSKTRVVNARSAIALVPTIRRQALRGGVLYSDGQFNDSRLALSLARTAARSSAVVLNYARVISLTKSRGRVCGATIVDSEDGRQHAIKARAVVNATGSFADAIRQLDDPGAEPIVATSQGIHLVLPKEFLPGSTGVMVPRTDDGRVCFIIPWQDRVLVGTTDTVVPGPTSEPVALPSEVDFLLDCVSRYLSKAPRRDDILSVFAGVRPLVKGSTEKTSALSRDHTLLVSSSGLVTICGGKWTTYRHMAESTVDCVAQIAGLPSVKCSTRHLRLDGAHAARSRWSQFGVPDGEADEYEERYPGELHRALPYSMGMVGYVVEHEMAVRLEDVLARRLRAVQLNATASLEAAPKVASLMAAIQGHDEAWITSQLDEFACLVERSMEAAVPADSLQGRRRHCAQVRAEATTTLH